MSVLEWSPPYHEGLETSWKTVQGLKRGESQSPGARKGNEWSRSRKAEEERSLPSHTPGTA